MELTKLASHGMFEKLKIAIFWGFLKNMSLISLQSKYSPTFNKCT